VTTSPSSPRLGGRQPSDAASSIRAATKTVPVSAGNHISSANSESVTSVGVPSTVVVPRNDMPRKSVANLMARPIAASHTGWLPLQRRNPANSPSPPTPECYRKAGCPLSTDRSRALPALYERGTTGLVSAEAGRNRNASFGASEIRKLTLISPEPFGRCRSKADSPARSAY
jgi:hypothetical protein